jgi:2-keto-4-pentenoate hydratase/2-oxohepta-3-ene-1,7-dioic acid hydratase in catechol pathway
MVATPARWRLPGDRVSVEIEGIGSLSNPLMGANFLLVRFQPERLF